MLQVVSEFKASAIGHFDVGDDDVGMCAVGRV